MSNHSNHQTISPKDLAKAGTAPKAPANNVSVTPSAGNKINVDTLDPPPAVVIEKAKISQSSDNVQQVNELCERFINVREGSKTVQLVRGRESTYAERSIKALSKLLTFIWANQNDVQVLDTFRKFMVKHRSKHLACENALQGINLISSEDERGRYQIMYILMYELTNPDRLRNDFDFTYAEKVCHNNNCNPSNGYIQFISSRLR